MYLNVIGVNKDLVAVNLSLYVVLIGIGELDRIVGVTDGLGRRELIQNCRKADRNMVGCVKAGLLQIILFQRNGEVGISARLSGNIDRVIGSGNLREVFVIFIFEGE